MNNNEADEDPCQKSSSSFKSFAKKVSMGKKVEKVLKPTGKSSSSLHTNAGGSSLSVHTTTSSATLQNEPHKCTGKFKDDFENICNVKAVKYVPEIVLRSKRPGSSAHPHHSSQADTNKAEKTPAKGGKGGKAAAAGVVEKEADVVDADQNGENAELPPKTYVIRDAYEFFKPKINVEMDNPDKLDTVTELHIKGWKVEKPIMEVLQLCMPHVDRLNTINFWNCGLDEDTVKMFASMLGHCHNLKTVIIEGNPLPTPAYQALFYEDNSNVQNMFLRNNQLDDEAIQLISYGLGDLRRQNTKLLHLHLNSNRISDRGAIHLARALRTNRTLITLNLANNNIGDEGGKALADVISKFALTQDEIVHRRKVISGRTYEKSSSPTSRRGGDSRERPNSQKSNPLGTETKKKSAKKEKEGTANTPGATTGGGTTAAAKNPKETLSKTKKDDKTLTRKASIDSKTLKTQKQTVKPVGKRSAKEQDEINNALLELSALTDMAENINDDLWLIGNRNLLCLNLSRNNLSEKTVQNFILALQYQKVIVEMRKGHGLGLMRLILQHNKFPNDNETYTKLLEILKLRDPFYKPPVSTDIAETASIHSGKESALDTDTRVE